MTKQTVLGLFVIALVGASLAPIAAGSAAHPQPHTYVGVAAGRADVDQNVNAGGANADLTSYALYATTPICRDVRPGVSPLVPPTPAPDQDPDAGHGGGCFPYVTTYGDDTGATVRIIVNDQVVRDVRYMPCIDMDGDGLCSAALGDHVDVCSSDGNLSETTGLACEMTLDASAADPTLYVAILGSVDATGSTPTAQWGSAGSILVL